METYWTEFKTREKHRPEEMREVTALSRRLGLKHADQLKATQRMIQTRYDKEVKDWRKNAPSRHAQAVKLLKGKPHEIADTYQSLTD